MSFGEGEVQENKRYGQILGVGSFVRDSGLDQIRKRHRCAQNMVLALARFEAVKKERGQTTAISGARGDVRDSNFELNLNEMNGCVIPFVYVPIIIEREREWMPLCLVLFKRE